MRDELATVLPELERCDASGWAPLVTRRRQSTGEGLWGPHSMVASVTPTPAGDKMLVVSGEVDEVSDWVGQP